MLEINSQMQKKLDLRLTRTQSQDIKVYKKLRKKIKEENFPYPKWWALTIFSVEHSSRFVLNCVGQQWDVLLNRQKTQKLLIKWILQWSGYIHCNKSVYGFEKLIDELPTKTHTTGWLREHTKKMLKIAAGKHHGTSTRAKWFLLKLLMWFSVFFFSVFHASRWDGRFYM